MVCKIHECGCAWDGWGLTGKWKGYSIINKSEGPFSCLEVKYNVCKPIGT